MPTRSRLPALLVGALASVLVPSAPAQNAITRVAVNRHGVEGNGRSPDGALSDDARFVAFSSEASNLIDVDGNGASDVFVRDFSTGVIVRSSVGPGGVEADGPSSQASISADGRFVAFSSNATNLVARDANGVSDVFVHDRDPDGNGVFDEGNGVTIRVSVASDGAEGNGDSDDPVISADGHLVIFTTKADNLVAGDANLASDVYLHDLVTCATARISLGPGGIEPDASSLLGVLSPDATLAAFTSAATNLVTNDTNQADDVFLRDLATGAIERISVDSSGVEGNLGSSYCGLTADDRYVVFRSAATNLVVGDTNGRVDVFLHDRATGATTRVSLGQGGVEGDENSGIGRARAISLDGCLLVFSSWARNLVPGDSNHAIDVFVRDLVTGDVSLVSAQRGGGISNYNNIAMGPTSDLTRILFESWATDIVSYDHNGDQNVFDGAEIFLRDMNIAAGTASTEAYGDDLAGTYGVPALAPAATPVLGTTVHVDLGNSSGAATLGFLVVGPDPAELRIGGGTLVADPFHWIVPVALPAGGGGIDGTIPSDPFTRGFSIFTQLIEVDAGAVHGLSMSRGVEFVYGD